METLEAKKARLKAARIARDAALPPPPPKPDPAAVRDAKMVKSLRGKIRALGLADPQLACEVVAIMLGAKSVDIINNVPYKKPSTES